MMKSVELNFAITVQEAPATCVKGLIIFKDDDSLFHGVDTCSPAFEHSPSRCESVSNAIEMSIQHVVWNCPGTAMHHHYRLVGQ